MTLADIYPDVLERLEENNPPVFWSTTNEILPTLIDAMFEAALITGTVQAVNIPVTLAAGTTFFSLQNNTAIGIPQGVVTALRLRQGYPIRKGTLKGLDNLIPGWQNVAPASLLRAWFPLGVSKFGIFPQLTAESVVQMDFVVSPVNQTTPYTTAIPVPFQEEFTSAFAEYSACMCRSKEQGVEAEEAESIMNSYLQKMAALSLYQGRIDSLVLTKAFGAQAGVTRREIT